MNVLIVSFYDDNFGDMLIRTCFTQLLRVVFKNLELTDYTVGFMPLTNPQDDRITSADAIFFAGGGLFGLSYLGFTEHVEHIVDLADEHDIPVVFSSLGMNNMDATDEDAGRLSDFWRKKCIRAVSVREKAEEFRRYAGDVPYTIQSVCDPVVWAAPVYAADLPQPADGKPIVGLNVVRGGLFQSNHAQWKLKDEETYLCELAKLLEQEGIDYRFFTNGSTLDNNVMCHLKDKYGVSEERMIFVDTSRELVQTIAGFRAVAAIRMHSSIVSYALGVPSFNLVWNPKVPDFYEKIGYPERALTPENWTAETAVNCLKEMLVQENYAPDPAVLMSLYRFLFETVRELLKADPSVQPYSYEHICRELRTMQIPYEEDDTDLRIKVRKGEMRYASLFSSDLARKAEVRKLKASEKKLKTGNQTLKEQLSEAQKEQAKAVKERAKAEEALAKAEKERAAAAKALEASEKQRGKMQRELNYLNSRFIVRIYRKIAGFFAKLRGKK